MRGRTLVAILLAGFVAVALAIVWRRTVGISQSSRVVELEAKRAELESERASIESDIRDASARQRLGATAEKRLGMHIPAPSQVVILPRAGANDNP